MKTYKHQVQYYETDQMAIVHHSNYIRWFEEARIDFLEQLGVGYERMEQDGIISPVLSVSAVYHSMVRFGDCVEIVLRVERYNGIKLRFSYEIYDERSRELRCSGSSEHCFLNEKRMPVSLKRKYPKYHEGLMRAAEAGQPTKGRLILASASPRRRELMQQIGMDFEVIPAKGEERIPGTEPAKAVRELSKQKALEIAGLQEQPCLVIGADTVVACDGVILGKPKDEEDAVRMLKLLQGRTHSVFTGVTVYEASENQPPRMACCFAEETKVTMYPVNEEEIRAYAATGDPLDKAGAYAIQGASAAFIQAIDGDYNNVVGLPVARLYQELKKMENRHD